MLAKLTTILVLGGMLVLLSVGTVLSASQGNELGIFICPFH